MSMDQVIGNMNPGSHVPIANMPPLDPFYPEETGIDQREMDSVKNRIWNTQDNYGGRDPKTLSI
jgi:hypothetical protein